MSDLDIRARGLIDFSLQSIEDGLTDISTSKECFSEADHAISVLRKMLLNEDEVLHAQLMLLQIFDTSFVRIFENQNQSEREQYLKEALDKLSFAKTLF